MEKPANRLCGRLRLAFEDDPDTPVLVEFNISTAQRGSGTYECVCTEGEIEGESLTEKEVAWLESHRKLAEEWYDFRREVD